jgi:RNA polymerase sigma-70 factor (ECF subfamily)
MNRADFDALYREHYHHVRGLCRRMLGGAADAEDAAQEAFMRGFRAIGQYKTRDPFGPWINTIASNYCIDVLRRRRRLSDVFTDVDSDEAELRAADAGRETRDQDGVTALISAHTAKTITRAVEALPEKYRLPVVLAYYADASYDEIADTLGISRNHVGVLLVRAKERLRDTLADDLNNEER